MRAILVRVDMLYVDGCVLITHTEKATAHSLLSTFKLEFPQLHKSPPAIHLPILNFPVLTILLDYE
jgi:hypothetical protein